MIKITKEVENAVNKQIHLQWSTFYDFLSMSAWLETTPFKGFAKRMLVLSEKHQKYAIQLFEYLKNHFGKLEISSIEKPTKQFDSVLHVFQMALEKKQIVTNLTYKLYDLALTQKDIESQELLHGFLHEQVHEEKDIQDMIDKIELAGQNPDALIHLDYKEEVIYASSNS